MKITYNSNCHSDDRREEESLLQKWFPHERSFVVSLLWMTSLVLASCTQDYLTYDTVHNGTYFLKDSVTYSFGVSPTDTTQHTIQVPVRILGTVSQENREFAFQIEPDSSNATLGQEFTIGQAIIRADSINGYIPVTVYRNQLKGTYATGYTRYRLGLRLIANDNFKPTLTQAQQYILVKFDNAVDMPEWYAANGSKVWSKTNLGEWHPYKLIKMVEYFHALKDILPETYVKMVDLYGENLEHIEYGDPYVYKTVFRKYIYSPMYDFFSDPANHDFIVSLYPDFPFDFPDPFAEN